MKLKFKTLLMSLTIVLGTMVLLNSCDDDDDPLTFDSNPEQFCAENPADARCFDFDPDAFCDANPFDNKCCIPTQDVDCYCTTGDNGTTDTEYCCLFKYNPECFCTENPDDPQCAQDFGVGNGIGLVIDFESGTESFAPDFYNPSGQVEFNGSTEIEAVEGDSYISLVMAADDPARDWHDFKYWPSAMDSDPDNDNEALIDFSTMADPHLNFWLNTGADSAALTIDFQTLFEDGLVGEWAYHTFLQDATNGKWKLYSVSLTRLFSNDETLAEEIPGLALPNQSWGGTDKEFSLTSYNHQMIKFALMAQDWAIMGDYEAHLDAISITDGPLEQLPWIE
ncbi:hypothetical protein OO013_00250 [Mangrovivirga sp. M17]|uniref:Uncharacterized protein n=1 Tax=Mangrovivirga halotolerans TaxID=2993936 RepID=A0ABT3RLJ9_9BACT|nr:hypothetical protein [Mangrovivirga halotolerans]MCX2742269.1 hypothetical protein [Mangrovivirga halotolerans]